MQAQQPVAALPRRLRACLGCRGSKLRCSRSEGNSKENCDRCVATGRQRIVPDSKRRKARRLGSGTVAALEKKVDFLISKFTDEDAGSQVHANENKSQYAAGMSDESRPLSAHLQKGRGSPQNASTSAASQVRQLSGSWESRHNANAKRVEILGQFSFFLPRPSRTDELYRNDVINRGLVSCGDAEIAFERFTRFQLRHFPVLVFPVGTTVSSVRRTKPTLFLAILRVASAVLGQEVQRMLNREITHTFADYIMIRGEKDLDLVQALEVSILWYFPPDKHEEVKIHQLCHIATTMSLELGLGQKSHSYISRLPSKDANPQSTGVDDIALEETLMDGQRAWLVCYILCGILSMTARRPGMLRWTHHMDYCIISLDCSTALESDRVLCLWARGQRIAEEIAEQFYTGDESAKIDLQDEKTRFILRGFEQQLEQWRDGIPAAASAGTLQYSFHLMNLYLHEIALHVEHNINDFRPPFIEETLSSASTEHRSSTPTQRKYLAICVFSVKQVLETFLSFEADTLCSMPLFNFVRAAYATVALMKIQLMVLRPETDFVHIIKEEDLMVKSYFHRLRQSLQTVARTQNLKAAVIFNLVVQMLQVWFQKQGRRIDLTSEDQSVLHTNRHFDNREMGTSQGGGFAGLVPSKNINQSDASTGGFLFNRATPFLETGLHHSMSESENHDWRDYDFETLFAMDDGRL